MAEDSPRISGLSSGLAVILSDNDHRGSSSKSRCFSYCDEFRHQSVERTLEYVFGLPNKSIDPVTSPIDTDLIRSIIKNRFSELAYPIAPYGEGDGICIVDNGLGPNVVCIEKVSICGDMRIVKPPLIMESFSMFSSSRANACVWSGKWMYEVILETSGIQQLGWATLACPFTDHEGVGDADDSYAFDGRRVRKWNKEAERYGQSWVVGDVIGCCIDLDRNEISFYRNGISLGVAFSGIRKMGPGIGYHPAISLSQGSYSYLALACHIFRREELMVLWWKSVDFEFLFEGFLSRKNPNKQDLEYMMPSVWWPGSREDVSYESSMDLTTTALSEAINEIEEKHRDLCRLVIQFIPPTTSPQLPGSVFRTFLQNLLLKNRGADRSASPSGVLSNSIVVSLYAVILHFLSEGFGIGSVCDWLRSSETDGPDIGFLHRGGQRSFPVYLFFKDESHQTVTARLGGSYNHILKLHPPCDQEVEVIRWEEGCMDDNETRVTHSTRQKPCCCSSYDAECMRSSKDPMKYAIRSSRGIPMHDRSAHVATECTAGNLNDEITDKPSSSEQSDTEFGYCPMQQQMRIVQRETNTSSATLREEELLDFLLLFYHMGLAPDFKQASHYMSHQSQLIALLEETDKQIRERACREQLKRLKEARSTYRDEVIDCVRHCAWNRISLFSRWKQRGMYAMCMWTVQLLLVLSKMDSVFVYIPEFYVETLVDCFHVLRKGDPPFVPSTIFLKQGLASFVTFVVNHFNDPRISSADLKDLLLQSISVLVQYKEYLVTFESNEAATKKLPKSLLLAFDNRSWIPVTNILLRLCKGSGFGSSKHGESSSSSIIFQALLREACVTDEGLFSPFLNRLFNTLSWTMTEFSVSIREMQEKYQVLDSQQRKCNVIFDLSCNLARVLEFFTREIPQAFLLGTDTNLRRLTELILFILNHVTSAADAEFFDLSLRRNGQSLEKVNRGMILAPLVGIILNLWDASAELKNKEYNDVVGIFASMECLNTVNCGLRLLLDYNWAGSFRGDGYVAKLERLENFLSLLLYRMESSAFDNSAFSDQTDANDSMCCICYEREADTCFKPCSHRSCYGCISRHLLNCQRCFFCNAPLEDVMRAGTN
ncbi:E3 ubiquitin-protein ligase RKP isoform X2 [Momordica charantia]|uniref:E3 ubiquitin-protein ligase RKP isoform X2 n=1 Tax=Momordica charantia TaxID=3673 RepID=A0A6J1BU55_MOMCH|nr:E3 ubiquitin-protein ligase RKP isoform X2 [Momordica charantia]